MRKVLLATLLGFISLQSSCLSRTRVLPPEERLLPVQDLGRTELIERLAERSRAIRTLNATVTLDASGGSLRTGVLTEYRQTKGFLLVDRPNHIRIRAQAPLALATVFDMVSDGFYYRVWVPTRNTFILGEGDAPPKQDNPILNLRPGHILEALFIDTELYLQDPNVVSFLEEVTEGRSRYYVVHFVNIAGEKAELLEKLWIDRTDLEVSRKQVFATDGKLETDVRFMDYQAIDATTFPQVVIIERPVEDYSLTMTFQKTTLNETFEAETFTLERPAGAELVQLNP